ncbi:MAG: MBL fold metallo-hydrolase [Planctomycetota bacterium]|jgi:glyoxylase-like metal-dependent hydrolase (beta-lactamase superfamily II)/8-oxo-dGTP pyrophosphatase MutT (NUDIX family)
MKSKDRIAATVLLLRGEGTELEIYLVERSPKLRFFGGYLALPGGVLDQEDGDHPGEGESSEALRQCAIRELFEETGVMLDAGLAAIDASELNSLRQNLLADNPNRVWQEYKPQQHGAENLEELCRIRTPPFAPVRYDTWFFSAFLPHGQEPEIWPGELTGGRFWKPADALQAWRAGELLIVPPVLMILSMLQADDFAAFRESTRAIAEDYMRGRLHQVRFSPGILVASLYTPTLPPATTTNCIIVGEERLFIIDPACPDAREQERFFGLLDELRAEGRELEAIILTHHHPDHTGAVRPTSKRYDLPVRAHELTLRRLGKDFKQGKPIGHGDRIPLGTAPDGSQGWELEAIFTPGHDKGHLCFMENRYRSLIAGDMVSTISSIIIDPPEGHMATYLQSLQTLRKLEIGTLYPAHGPAMPRGGRIIDKYLQHRQEREDAILAALESGLNSTVELLQVVYQDVDPRIHAMAERSLLAGLIKLQEDGKVKEIQGSWQPC